MERLTATIAAEQNSYPQYVRLPSVEYAAPAVQAAFAAWRTAQVEAKEARDVLDRLDRDAKATGHRDGNRWDEAQERLRLAEKGVLDSWAAIHSTIGEQRAQLVAHHVEARDSAVGRLQSAAAELEAAAAEYAAAEAWRQAAETGDLVARQERIPGLLTLTGVLRGDSELDPTSGLQLALSQLPVAQVRV